MQNFTHLFSHTYMRVLISFNYRKQPWNCQHHGVIL